MAGFHECVASFVCWDVLWYVIQSKVFVLVSLWKGIESSKDCGTLYKDLLSYINPARQDCNNQCTSPLALKVDQKARRKTDFTCRWQRAMKKKLIFQAVWFPNKTKLVVHAKFFFFDKFFSCENGFETYLPKEGVLKKPGLHNKYITVSECMLCFLWSRHLKPLIHTLMAYELL